MDQSIVKRRWEMQVPEIFKRNQKMILLSCSFLLPFITDIFLSVLSGNGFNIARTAPYNSDEIFWHLQTAASEKYTMPQGYFGYNGSHAAVGTYGAWGPNPQSPIPNPQSPIPNPHSKLIFYFIQQLNNKQKK